MATSSWSTYREDENGEERHANRAGAALGGLALVGCYGSTEPATEVERESARLNARGTANSGPASSVFEYWPTGRQNLTRRTGRVEWPAGASGPISQVLRELRPGTPYSFRLCGADQGREDVCAQTRSFTTDDAVEDSARGSYFFSSQTSGGVSATSGPSGENPTGTLRLTSSCGLSCSQFNYTGTVTCLAVDGLRAAIGAVGTRRETPGNEIRNAVGLMTVVDGGLEGPDTLNHRWETDTTTPPDCENASFANQFNFDQNLGQFTVIDAPASATARR